MAKSRSGFSFWGILLFCIIAALVIGGLIYEGKNLAKTHATPTLSLAQAKQYCIAHGGVVQASPYQYTLCVFSDSIKCEVKSFEKGVCNGGLKQPETSSSQQLLCSQLGGKMLDDSTNNCTFSDGSICTSSDILGGSCHQ